MLLFNLPQPPLNKPPWVKAHWIAGTNGAGSDLRQQADSTLFDQKQVDAPAARLGTFYAVEELPVTVLPQPMSDRHAIATNAKHLTPEGMIETTKASPQRQIVVQHLPQRFITGEVDRDEVGDQLLDEALQIVKHAGIYAGASNYCPKSMEA
jgi:hypothetical protein